MSFEFSSVFKLNGKEISNGGEPFIMAEVACSHDGDPEKVRFMIDFVAEAGADGIQFQIFSTDNLLVPNHKFYSLVKELEISYPEWDKLIKYAKEKKLTVSVNILDESGLQTAVSSGADAIKLHSADLSNPQVFEIVSKEKLPLIISTGGSTLDEVEKAITVSKKCGVENILLMHGFQAFPTKLEDNNLNFIKTLQEKFSLPIGYQDHVDGSEDMAMIVPIMAVAKGSPFIEKHVTDNRERKGTDYQSALGSTEFKKFTKLLKDSWLVMGDEKRNSLSEAEINYRATFKKSIVAIQDIHEGEHLEPHMYKFMRGDIGIPPSNEDLIKKKIVKKKIKKFESITLEHIGESNG
ncbi:MAG: N-acetylneuraminate synthase family protein [Bacteriovoracaceae bacterium]|nr:N-acetylneuraminate synthase family protein [Bacteriovoracaceae bacterium]